MKLGSVDHEEPTFLSERPLESVRVKSVTFGPNEQVILATLGPKDLHTLLVLKIANDGSVLAIDPSSGEEYDITVLFRDIGVVFFGRDERHSLRPLGVEDGSLNFVSRNQFNIRRSGDTLHVQDTSSNGLYLLSHTHKTEPLYVEGQIPNLTIRNELPEETGRSIVEVMNGANRYPSETEEALQRLRDRYRFMGLAKGWDLIDLAKASVKDVLLIVQETVRAVTR